ncbi:hypothetical protein HC928_01325 [bacterium]|nr:hypothetical protein [bacterium]
MITELRVLDAQRNYEKARRAFYQTQPGVYSEYTLRQERALLTNIRRNFEELVAAYIRQQEEEAAA